MYQVWSKSIEGCYGSVSISLRNFVGEGIINHGQIGDQTGLFYTTNPVFYTGQLVWWKPMFFRTKLIFNGFVRWTDMLGNLWYFRISNILVHFVFV
jgi:hypothetical protein